jgi:hypothetical protein
MDPKRKLSGTAYMKKILMVTARWLRSAPIDHDTALA